MCPPAHSPAYAVVLCLCISHVKVLLRDEWSSATGPSKPPRCITVTATMTVTQHAGFPRAGFNRAKFARDGALRLFTIVNRAGEGHILLWEQVRSSKLTTTDPRNASALSAPLCSGLPAACVSCGSLWVAWVAVLSSPSSSLSPAEGHASFSWISPKLAVISDLITTWLAGRPG